MQQQQVVARWFSKKTCVKRVSRLKSTKVLTTTKHK
jgi:hypothetical protein